MIVRQSLYLIFILLLGMQNTFAAAATASKTTCYSYFAQNDILNTFTQEEKSSLETGANRLADLIGKSDSSELQAKEHINVLLQKFIAHKNLNPLEILEFKDWFSKRVQFYIELKSESKKNAAKEVYDRNLLLKLQKDKVAKIQFILEKYKAKNLSKALIRAHATATAKNPSRLDDVLFILDRVEYLERTAEIFRVIVQYDNLRAVRYFIDHHVDLNARDSKESSTALHLAVKHNPNLDVTELLLQAGADPTLKDDLNKIPLHYAAANSKPSVEKIRLLLNKDSHTQLVSRDNWGQTPLHCAIYSKGVDHVSALLQAGADPSKQDDQLRTPLFTALLETKSSPAILRVLIQADHGAQLNLKNNDNGTLFHLAVFKSIDIVKVFIEAGANPTLRNKSKQTPYALLKISKLAENETPQEREEKLKLLLQAIKDWETKSP